MFASGKKVVGGGGSPYSDTQYFGSEVDNGNSGAADTIDWTAGNKQKSTLTDNCTFTFSPEPSGPCSLVLRLVQDGVGSRTVTWPGDVIWPDGAPTLSTAAAAVDVIGFYYDGTDFYGEVLLDQNLRKTDDVIFNKATLSGLTASQLVFTDASKVLDTPAATDVTAAELEELTDASETTLHSHAGGAGGTFVDRGDASNYDLINTGMTLDGTWVDWDLSSIVPAGAKAVLLYVSIQDDAIGSDLAFRKNGDVNGYNIAWFETQVTDHEFRANAVVACDANRVIEYKATNTTWTNISLTVRGWWT